MLPDTIIRCLELFGLLKYTLQGPFGTIRSLGYRTFYTIAIMIGKVEFT